MLKSYIEIALRNLWRQRGFAAINIFGLAIGLASSIFILLYVINELTYDRFHDKSDRIYKVWVSGLMPTGVMLDAATAVVNRQLVYMQKKDPGFGKEQVLVVHRSNVLKERIDAFKEEITQHSNIISSANSSHIPSGGYWGNALGLFRSGRE